MDHAVAAHLHTIEMLESLLAAKRVILISRIIDENGWPEYSGSVSGPQKHSTAATLEGCIERLTDHPRMKVCLRPDCVSKGQMKHIDYFSADKDARDGHANVCKKCENKRVGGIGKKKKAALRVAAGHQDKALDAPVKTDGIVDGNVAPVHQDGDG